MPGSPGVLRREPRRTNRSREAACSCWARGTPVWRHGTGTVRKPSCEASSMTAALREMARRLAEAMCPTCSERGGGIRVHMRLGDDLGLEDHGACSTCGSEREVVRIPLTFEAVEYGRQDRPRTPATTSPGSEATTPVAVPPAPAGDRLEWDDDDLGPEQRAAAYAAAMQARPPGPPMPAPGHVPVREGDRPWQPTAPPPPTAPGEEPSDPMYTPDPDQRRALVERAAASRATFDPALLEEPEQRQRPPSLAAALAGQQR
ncbi:MAG: hypothetical protein ACREQ5_26030, partial [Candidatus Dormibacteria bacterium]